MIHPEELEEFVDIMKAMMKMPETSTVYRSVKQAIVKETLMEFIDKFEDRKFTYNSYVDSCVTINDYKIVFDKIVREQKEKNNN